MAKGQVNFRLDDGHRDLLRYLCFMKDVAESRVIQRALRVYAKKEAGRMIRESGGANSEELALLVKQLNKTTGNVTYTIDWTKRKLVVQDATIDEQNESAEDEWEFETEEE